MNDPVLYSLLADTILVIHFAVDDGFDGYITKPIQQSNFFNALSDVCGLSHSPVPHPQPGGDRDKCLAAGMDDYIVKAVDPTKLRVQLEKWLPDSRPQESAEEVSRDGDAADERDLDYRAV